MQLNADFSQRAVVHAARIPWVASPMPGVDRRMLDRIGDEVARATSIVRYAPGSQFSPHTHGGGEELLVLAGEFSDEFGDFPAGAYIRNPPTSRHTPRSGPGCVLLVKLWQFDLADRTPVRIDTRDRRFVPAAGRDGVAVLQLYRDRHEIVRLEQWDADATITLAEDGGIELLVLSGGFAENGEQFAAESWLRLPPGVPLSGQTGPHGCRVWIKTGHLAPPMMGPAAAAD